MEITHFFDVDLYLTEEEWVASIRDITADKKLNEVGLIKGAIIRKGRANSKKMVFVVDNSELGEVYRGKGLGKWMYEVIIKKILDLYPDAEFHSSESLNDYSRGVWNSLARKYMNVTKDGAHYEVKRGMIL